MKNKQLITAITISFILLIVLALFLKNTNSVGYSKLYISEVLADNFSIIQDEDGDYSDYIEIYNGYSFDINLKGYHLSDKEYDIDLWEFPDVTIKSGEYLIIYASGKDKLDKNIHTNFKLNELGEVITLTDKDGITLSKISYQQTSYNTSYGYNGKKYVYYFNPTPGKKNSGKTSKKPISSSNSDPKIRINEYITENKIIHDKEGNYSPMVELYNYGTEDINLNEFYISDNESKLSRYRLPKLTLKAGEYITIYLSNKNKCENDEIHANFKIKEKETITLANNYGTIIDKVEVIALPKNMSYGINKDGKWCYYATATFGKENNTKCFEKLGDVNE